MNAEDKDPFFLEVRDFYWNYLQEYAKREDASIGYINEGIRLLKTIDFAYRNLAQKSNQPNATASFGKPESDETQQESCWRNYVETLLRAAHPKEQPAEGGHSGPTSKSLLKVYADFWDNRLSSIASHKNT